MIPYKVAYHKPGSVADAIALMGQLDEFKLLGGGHSLIPVMKLRISEPENVIDISGLEELKVIRDNESSITIGAGVTHGEIANSAAIKEHAPMLSTAGSMVGDVQVRNFGTIGGSIAHADPSADWPAVLLAADANVVIQGANGKREVDIDQFFQGLFMTALGENEIIVAIRIPKTAFNKNSTYVKFPQPASRFALVGCAAAVGGGNARVAFSGVSAKPFRDTSIENAIKSGGLDVGSIASATASVADDVSLMQDHFASQKYRKHLAGIYARKALEALA